MLAMSIAHKLLKARTVGLLSEVEASSPSVTTLSKPNKGEKMMHTDPRDPPRDPISPTQEVDTRLNKRSLSIATAVATSLLLLDLVEQSIHWEDPTLELEQGFEPKEIALLEVLEPEFSKTQLLDSKREEVMERVQKMSLSTALTSQKEAAVREGKIRTYIHDSHASPSSLSQLIEQARKRPHGTHLHLQRLDVVGRLLEQPLRAQLLASGDQPLQRSDPCLYLHRLVLVRSLSQVSPHLRGSQRLVLAPAAVTCRSPPEEEEAAAECAAPVAVTGGPGEAHLRCHLYPTTPLNEPGVAALGRGRCVEILVVHDTESLSLRERER
ncbi:hypothetical protein MUK42_28609 [Musa troglodytarum]|uniref:Uncharacterized protein n=1 Tax=Musa troglodytarum TaxID=320322 RepID=A0A9E7FME2_9LILI|nr:hypothetical protein MUK42_28609 [Musa troglodytarum]